MGQVQSDASSISSEDQLHTQDSSSLNANSSQQKPASIDSLIEEAAAYGSEGNESLDAVAQKALECPCIADLRNGPCGVQFSNAFVCFLKSTAEEKGSDCVHPFVKLQYCIKTYPNAFSKEVLEEGETKEKDATTQEYKIIPPIWSRESQPSNSKL